MDPYRKLTAAKILDLGKYSMVVNTILPDIKTFIIYGKYNKEYWAKEVIASEKGCIVYFDEMYLYNTYFQYERYLLEIRCFVYSWYKGNRPKNLLSNGELI